MVSFILTNKIVEAAKQASEHSDEIKSWYLSYLKSLDTSLKSITELEADESISTNESSEVSDVTSPTPNTIEHKLVFRISTILQEHNQESEEFSLINLTKGSRMYFEAPKPRVKSAKLLEILSKIESENQTKEYHRMVSSILPSNLKSSSSPFPNSSKAMLRENGNNIGAELKETSKILTAIVNVGISVAAVVATIMYFGDAVTTDLGMVFQDVWDYLDSANMFLIENFDGRCRGSDCVDRRRMVLHEGLVD
ncbi:hypothetical protein HK098_001676 [Nowakowskiella sp. JEL0407]|nr:hypothetical protein HK098_001676 [Nowakowskiella sp. JEL0407]